MASWVLEIASNRGWANKAERHAHEEPVTTGSVIVSCVSDIMRDLDPIEARPHLTCLCQAHPQAAANASVEAFADRAKTLLILIPKRETESIRRKPGGKCQPNLFAAKTKPTTQLRPMKPTIEFKPATMTIDPWKKAAAKTYLDEMLLPEFADRQIRLNEGCNWMRIVPAKESGSDQWMHGLHVLETPTGKFAHPKTIVPSSRGVWDAVYSLLSKTAPKKLFSKANLGGLRLLPKPMSLCWVIVRSGNSEDSPHVVRLLTLSGYLGERGGTPGLGYQLLQLSEDRDENGDLSHDITGAESGVQINIEKIVSKESKFPRYILRGGRQPSRISDVMASLSESEADVLQPLENVVRRMTEEEQWARLERLMPASEVAAIRETIEG